MIYLTGDTHGDFYRIAAFCDIQNTSTDGTKELWLNVTYNYSTIYYKPEVFWESGIRSIYGLSGSESIPLLKKAAEALGDDVVPDYWTPSDGNAKRALMQLIAMANLRPDGIWDGD